MWRKTNSPYTVEDLKDGDVIALNDPYMMDGGTSHLPDILLVRPIFYDDGEGPEHIGHAPQWGNLMDVGGSTAGSIPIDARSIYEEGVRLPPVKLYDAGKPNEEVLRFFCHNSRTPRNTAAWSASRRCWIICGQAALLDPLEGRASFENLTLASVGSTIGGRNGAI